jgi:phage shock protein PspC (stress-responsive transcriptional regulator)
MVRRGRGGDHDRMNSTSSLIRSSSDRKVAGVAGGLAEYLNVDPLLVRIGFAVSTLFTGAGIVAYAVMWALVPSEDTQATVSPAAA